MLTILRPVRAGVVLAAAVLVGAFALRADASQAKGNFERSLSVSDLAKLMVETGSGDITVKTGDASTVHVRGTIHINFESGGDLSSAEAKLREIEAHPPIEQSGNSIRIGRQEGSGYDHVSIDYELVVPPGSEFTARTGSGDLKIWGPLSSADARTGSGDAVVESVKGNLRLTTGSGDVAMKESGGSGAEIETGSGNVIVDLPKQGGLNLSVRTGSGDISTDHDMPFESVDTRRGVLKAKVRGGGADFIIQTGSGDVHIH
jgi:DUF4097 and DUF4098 domain-containing protein YvlB